MKKESFFFYLCQLTEHFFPPSPKTKETNKFLVQYSLWIFSFNFIIPSKHVCWDWKKNPSLSWRIKVLFMTRYKATLEDVKTLFFWKTIFFWSTGIFPLTVIFNYCIKFLEQILEKTLLPECTVKCYKRKETTIIS